ncbi:hypothetical protein [Aliarcobacter cryaerophilus]|uniref:hypothetical protein n=1 Tax=Aliarcobacter cryaerophilus TaxID=28198 RepID=UPI00082501D5|nr:hypothetical protein [Aliarcobacter cryaerophilus]
MKKLLFVLMLTFGLLKASTNKEKDEVLKVIKNYANSIACETTFDNPDFQKLFDNIVLSYKDSTGETNYYVLWGGDIGCNGGTSSSSYYVSEVGRYSNSRPFLVIKRDIFGSLDDINFRAIKSFKKIDDNKYEIVSINYDDNDPNCCPSLKQKYIVYKLKGEWKVFEKTLIEIIKY